MQVLLKIPVTLSGITYGKGQHEIPPEACAGWFFESLKSDGNLIDLTPKKPKHISKKKTHFEEITHSEEKPHFEEISSCVDSEKKETSQKKHKRKTKKKKEVDVN